MQALAKWLVARPHNAVFGLAVTVLLPASQIVSGALVVLLVLSQGLRLAAFEALVAAAMLVLVNLLLGGSFASVLVLVSASWIPAVLLAMAVVATRSLTLTLQLSVLIAIAALLVFEIAVGDVAAFWQPTIDNMVAVLKEMGLQLETELLVANAMTVSAVLIFWTMYVIALLWGYWAYRKLPFETSDFGRFRDLNFGHVIAFTLALASLLMLVIKAAWLQNTATLVFAMFTMQGLALVNWLHSKRVLPMLAVIAIYVLSPFLQVFLSIFGYLDAWFGFRRRLFKA